MSRACPANRDKTKGGVCIFLPRKDLPSILHVSSAKGTTLAYMKEYAEYVMCCFVVRCPELCKSYTKDLLRLHDGITLCGWEDVYKRGLSSTCISLHIQFPLLEKTTSLLKNGCEVSKNYLLARYVATAGASKKTKASLHAFNVKSRTKCHDQDIWHSSTASYLQQQISSTDNVPARMTPTLRPLKVPSPSLPTDSSHSSPPPSPPPRPRRCHHQPLH
jgi:hypothetical protein